MPRGLRVMTGFVFVGLAVSLMSCAAPPNVVPDPWFQYCLNGFYFHPPEEPQNRHIHDAITPAQLRSLSGDIQCDNDAITSIEGAQYLTNVLFLGIQGGLGVPVFSDLSPVAGLTNLTLLDVSGNQITDLSPLAGLTNLNTLILSHNLIADVTPLAGLTNVSDLDLSNNQINDVSPLASLPFISSPPNGDTGYLITGQSLTATAVTGPQSLPRVVGIGSLDWKVTQGEATIKGDTISYPLGGTVVLAFADSGSTFGGTVTVTVTG